MATAVLILLAQGRRASRLPWLLYCAPSALVPGFKLSCFGALLPNDQHDERAGLDAALGSATGCCRRSLGKLRGTQKDLLRLRIEGHRACAWLRLDWSSVFVIVRRLFVKD